MAAATLSDIKDLKDATYFRRQAKWTTAKAQLMLQPDVRLTLSNLARAYEELAVILIRAPSGCAIRSCYRRGHFRRARPHPPTAIAVKPPG
jgi:hypothetical protein